MHHQGLRGVQRKLAVIRSKTARRFHRPKPEGTGVSRQHPQISLVHQIGFLAGCADCQCVKNRVPFLVVDDALAKFIALQFRQFHSA